MNGTQKSILVKLAGSIGVAGASLIALPSVAASLLHPSPKVFSEATYNRLAQMTPDTGTTMTPATESMTTEGMTRSASPSLAKVNPNPSIFNEAPYNRLLSQSTGGSSGTMMQPSGSGVTSGEQTVTPSPGQPSAPVAEPSNTTQQNGSGVTSGEQTVTPSPGQPSAPVAEPSNIGPTMQQSPGSSGDVTVPTTPSESTSPGSVTTPDSTITPDSTTTPNSTITPDSTTPSAAPSNDSTTPSATPSGGQSGGIRALW
jgi:hypothetical protein